MAALFFGILQPMSNMLIRAISGALYVIILIGCLLWSSWSAYLFFFLVATIGLGEFYNMAGQKNRVGPHAFLGVVGGMVLFGAIMLAQLDILDWKYLLLMLPISVGIALLELFSSKSTATYNVSTTFFGWIWVTLPFACFLFLSKVNGIYDWQLPLGFFIMLWINDTGAYLSGRSMGKHKLFPRVSPNKTWEGFFGGVLLCIGAAFVIAHFYNNHSLADWLAVAVVVSIFSNIGDLFESLIKREFGVKDSGKIMPGHGGVLDRFDGVLLAAPLLVVYFYLT